MFRIRPLRRHMLGGTAMIGCLAAGPALAERCETPPGHWQRFGDLYVGVRHEGGNEVGDRVDYVVEVAVLHAGPVGAVKKLNPHNFTVRIQSPNGYGTTAYAWHNGVDAEPWFPTFPVHCRMTYAPVIMFRGLDKAQAKTAILLIDGQQTLVWDISDKIVRQAPRPIEPAPAPAPTPTPAPTPAPPPPPLPPAPTNDGFKPVGKFDVRLDKVVAEGRYWHVYMTLRNASSGTLVQAQGVDVRLEDSDGVGVESGQAVRARPGPPELFGSPPPTTRPGGTLPVKFVFDKRDGAAPARIIVMEGEHEAAFRLG